MFNPLSRMRQQSPQMGVGPSPELMQQFSEPIRQFGGPSVGQSIMAPAESIMAPQPQPQQMQRPSLFGRGMPFQQRRAMQPQPQFNEEQPMRGIGPRMRSSNIY